MLLFVPSLQRSTVQTLRAARDLQHMNNSRVIVNYYVVLTPFHYVTEALF